MSVEALRDELAPLLPRYRDLTAIGKGGMGVVFSALDVDLDQRVALKILSALPAFPGDDDAERVSRFKREITLNRKVKHPNVATVYEFGKAGRYYYVSMELLPGRDLRSRLVAQGRFPAARAVPLLRQIALGIQAAHELGVVHRDLKPENVMVDDDGAVALLDFGLARREVGGQITQERLVIGTPLYLSPEQALGEAVDARSDLYSIGVIAFELLTGCTPFQHESPMRICLMHVHDPVPVDRLAEAGVPPELSAIVLRCLAKDPDDRFPSAAVLELELDRLGLAEPAPDDVSRDTEPVLVPAADTQRLARPTEAVQTTPAVLVVDDDSLLASFASSCLAHSGCATTVASSGEEALEALMSRHVDLVLMDITMPRVDGFDATRIIKGMPRFAELPVVLMSATVDRSRIAFAFQAGATDVIAKPLAYEALVAKVWRILTLRGFRRASAEA